MASDLSRVGQYLVPTRALSSRMAESYEGETGFTSVLDELEGAYSVNGRPF